MIDKIMTSDDGVAINYAHSEIKSNAPWLVLIIPFGLKTVLAKEFFDKFSGDYNVMTWESRLILADEEYQVKQAELSSESHLADLFALLQLHNIESAILVGYCSGAGIALAAAAKDRQLFSKLLLVHGEFVMLSESNCLTQIGLDIDAILPMASASEMDAEFILEKVAASNADRNDGLPEHVDINLPFSKREYFHRYAMNYLSYRELDFETIARSIDSDTFILTGEKDIHTNTTSSMRIKELIENSEILIDPQADHYGILRSNSNTLVNIDKYLAMGVTK